MPTKHALGDLDPVRALPYGLAAIIAASEAGQMAASDQVQNTLSKTACAEGGVHRWKADVEGSYLAALVGGLVYATHPYRCFSCLHRL